MSDKRNKSGNSQSVKDILCSYCKRSIQKGEQYWVNKNKKGKRVYTCDECNYALCANACQNNEVNLTISSLD